MIMGSPASTFFCGNGHILADIGHHGIIDTVPPCQYCDDGRVYMTLEWWDSDYGDINRDVPHTPIDYDLKVIEVNIPRYDISKLKERQKDGVDREMW